VTSTLLLSHSVREQRAWYLYDWANSAFPTTVVGVFLGPYLTALAGAAADPRGFVHPFGIPLAAGSVWSYVTGLSVGLQVLALPVVGAIADYGRRKKECLAVTAYLGAAATVAMFFLQGSAYLWGAALMLIGNVNFGASIVVYNSFLPEIAPPEQRDAVSSKGWAVGYVGGGLLLALNLALASNAGRLGISQAMVARVSLCSAGVWWAIFTVPVLAVLRNRGAAKTVPPGRSAAGEAVRQLAHTLRDMRRYPQTMKFLIAYLLYNDAIQTILIQAGVFGNQELGMPLASLALAFLISQIIGIFGATSFNRLALAITAKRAIEVSIALWIAVLVYTYLIVRTPLEYFILAGLVGLVMGGSQALSRSTFAQLIPQGKEAEYFGIYEISDKGTSWLGPIFVGVAYQLTMNYRLAILSLIVFFAAGLAVLTRVSVEQGERDLAFEVR
jgi:MFS transporter, UMF1 family